MLHLPNRPRPFRPPQLLGRPLPMHPRSPPRLHALVGDGLRALQPTTKMPRLQVHDRDGGHVGSARHVLGPGPEALLARQSLYAVHGRVDGHSGEHADVWCHSAVDVFRKGCHDAVSAGAGDGH